MRLHQQVDTKTTGSRGQREDSREVRWEGHSRPCFVKTSCVICMGTQSCFPTPSPSAPPSSRWRRWRVVREQCLPKGTHCRAGSRKNKIERVQRQRKEWRQVKDRQTKKPAPMAPDSPPASHLHVCLSLLSLYLRGMPGPADPISCPVLSWPGHLPITVAKMPTSYWEEATVVLRSLRLLARLTDSI